MSALPKEIREKIIALLPRYPSKQAVTLPALHLVQDEFRCVPNAAIREIASILDLHPSQIHDTLSFYGFFRPETNPLGKHRVWVCRSLACMLRGGEELFTEMCEAFHVKPGEKTPDGELSIEFAECLGACEGAPCIVVDDECHVNITVEKAKAVLKRS